MKRLIILTLAFACGLFVAEAFCAPMRHQFIWTAHNGQKPTTMYDAWMVVDSSKSPEPLAGGVVFNDSEAGWCLQTNKISGYYFEKVDWSLRAEDAKLIHKDGTTLFGQTLSMSVEHARILPGVSGIHSATGYGVGGARIYAGDANFDGAFDSADIVQVFQAGRYEDFETTPATWMEGDWNEDSRFTSADLVSAMQTGRYEATEPIQSRIVCDNLSSVAIVPEPSTLLLSGIGLFLITLLIRASKADPFDNPFVKEKNVDRNFS